MLDMIDDPLFFFPITYCSYFKFGKETLGVLNDQLKTGTKYRLSASDLPKGKELWRVTQSAYYTGWFILFYLLFNCFNLTSILNLQLKKTH